MSGVVVGHIEIQRIQSNKIDEEHTIDSLILSGVDLSSDSFAVGVTAQRIH